ncbi:hypothetical protein ECG_09206 [Echinococcus granulosus]|uniref:Expressed conserved protein n=1 Tax=Echinococcus granulosus TaxID=6210 RepID=A0A068WN59_ECHGR|nr:hypothetical protein ECG_09206 [Echinococcus granulosus]CDS21202.1 expressed conserved protein [Echinococcus granulosus]
MEHRPHLTRSATPFPHTIIRTCVHGQVPFQPTSPTVVALDSRGLLRTLIHCPGKLSLTLPMPSSPNLSPMSRQARALHIIRASSQPGRLRFADIAHLDQTITTMRRLVPPVSSTTVPEKINTVEDLETLLIDTIHLFKRLIEDPEIVTALRARLASKTTAASNEVPVTAPHLSVPSVQTEVDNLFTLLKLKRRSKKRIIPMRI